LLLLANGIFNIVRSVTYNKPQPRIASLIDNDAWSIAFMPGNNGIEKVHLSYTLKY